MPVLYHGGAPNLKPGDIITPGHQRQEFDDCPICQARRDQGENAPIDATKHPENVYCTPNRLYARFHASMYGHGDVYQVRPLDCTLTRSDEDPIESYRCERLEIIRITDVNVELTWKERRRLTRQWQRADNQPFNPNPLPRNPTPQMLARWQQRETQIAKHLLHLN